MTQLTLLDGTPVAPAAFGTMQFGGGADESASAEMFGACRVAGIQHFDTAVGYTDGRSEMILGQLIAPVRDQIYLASKLGFEGGCSAANLAAHFDRSRRQLHCDMIDLLYLHRFDDETPLEESFATLARWQSDGLIRHIGVSNYAAWQIVKAQHVAAGLGTRIDAVQPMFSLVKRQAEVEIFPAARDQDIAILPYSPLGGGLLSGKYAKGATGRLTEVAFYRARYDVPWMHRCAADLSELAAEVGTHPATLAVAWVAAHPARPMPIVSARSAVQLAPSLAGLSFELSPELLDRITGLSQAPGVATDRIEEA